MTSTTPNSWLLGTLLALAGFSLLSFGDATIKYLSATYSSYSLVFYNSVFALLILLLLSPWLGGVGDTLRDKRLGLHFLRSVLVFVQLSLIVYAFAQLPLATAYALAFVAPAFSALLAMPLLGDRLNWRHMVGIGCGFIGVLVILRPGLVTIEFASIAAVLSALFFSLVNITARYMRDSKHTLLSWAFYPHLLIILVSPLLFGHELRMLDLGDVGYLAFMGAASAFGGICLARAFAYAHTAIAASMHYSQMLWGVLLGYLLFDDVIDSWTLVGAMIVIVSGLWLLWSVRRC